MPVVIKWWRAHHGCSESDADRVATKALDALLQRAPQLQDSDPAMDGPYRMPVNTDPGFHLSAHARSSISKRSGEFGATSQPMYVITA